MRARTVRWTGCSHVVAALPSVARCFQGAPTGGQALCLCSSSPVFVAAEARRVTCQTACIPRTHVGIDETGWGRATTLRSSKPGQPLCLRPRPASPPIDLFASSLRRLPLSLSPRPSPFLFPLLRRARRDVHRPTRKRLFGGTAFAA